MNKKNKNIIIFICSIVIINVSSIAIYHVVTNIRLAGLTICFFLPVLLVSHICGFAILAGSMVNLFALKK